MDRTHMRSRQLYRILFSLLGCCLILLLAACGSGGGTSSGSHNHTTGNPRSTATTAPSRTTPTPASTTVPMPATSTSCPTAATGRAAVMEPLVLGSHANLVYVYNVGTADAPGTAFLKRYDTVTGTKTTIVTLSNTYIANAQVSTDGEWVLFTAITNGQAMLQMIRMDGQGLQTLYCASPEGGAYIVSALSNVQWSTDQRLVVFSHFSNANGSGNEIYLLNLATGKAQIELYIPGIFYAPITWLDNTRVYLSHQAPDGPPDSLYLLDTSKGANQSASDLTLVFSQKVSSGDYPCWNNDSSYDAKTAFVSECTAASSTTRPGEAAIEGPSDILTLPAAGGASHSLFSSAKGAVTVVRAVTSSTLLFIIDSHAIDSSVSVDTSQNGLWKINTEGSGITRLTGVGNLNSYSQFPWSNLSRDSSLYALQVINGSTQSLEYGSMSGGAPTPIASTSAGSTADLDVVGWTTM